ncbi:hypothetical protein [Aestuariivivens sediminis]|uniref:hypothetical protein n=1 Tax=Aestuariivivens sediminis TaxID=2913557 RepID=UPI001F5AC760|nr:hypothetical protein [Aestuariivivens sediminis]
MTKTILLILLGVFYILNDISPLINMEIYEVYFSRRALIAPKFMVKVSGVLLIFGGSSLVSEYFMIIGIIDLSLFLIVASLTTHQFWKEKGKGKAIGRHARYKEYDHWHPTGTW